MLQEAHKCAVHSSQTLDYYCSECRRLVCSSCVLSPDHRAHSPEITDAPAALPEHQSRLLEYIAQANGCLQAAENIMDNMARSAETLKENRKRAENKIQKYFHRMRSILVDRERHFVTLLNQSVEETKASMGERRKTVRNSMNGVIQGLKALGELSERGKQGDIRILEEQSPVIDSLTQHMEAVNQLMEFDVTELDTSVTMPCFEDRNFEKICRQAGDPDYRACAGNCTAHPSAQSPHSPLPPTIASPIRPVRGLSDPPPVPPRASKKRVLVESKAGSISPTGSDLISSNEDLTIEGGGADSSSAALPPPIPPKSPRTGRQLPQWMIDYKEQLEKKRAASLNESVSESNGEESGVLSLRPVPKARTRLSKSTGAIHNGFDSKSHDPIVKVQPPTPNSSDAAIRPSLEILARMMLGPGEDRESKLSPSGICLGRDNVIIVSDRSVGLVRILRRTGKFLDFIGKDCSGDNTISHPTAVTCDSFGNVYIADKSPPKILKFTKAGKFVSRMISKRNSVLGDPRGLAVTHDGYILVSDWERSCIHVFDATGKHSRDFRPPPDLSENFRPAGLSVDGRGRVVVADAGSHRIWIFTPDGDMLRFFGWEGHNPGDLYHPSGVTVDLKGQIIVADSGNHRLSIYSDSGDFVACFGECGSELGQFRHPADVCIDVRGSLIVADEGNGRLQVFDKLQ